MSQLLHHSEILSIEKKVNEELKILASLSLLIATMTFDPKQPAVGIGVRNY